MTGFRLKKLARGQVRFAQRFGIPLFHRGHKSYLATTPNGDALFGPGSTAPYGKFTGRNLILGQNPVLNQPGLGFQPPISSYGNSSSYSSYGGFEGYGGYPPISSWGGGGGTASAYASS